MATIAQIKRKRPINWSRESCLPGRAIPGCRVGALGPRAIGVTAILRELETLWGKSVGKVRDDDLEWPLVK
jgi:hypothetical protein